MSGMMLHGLGDCTPALHCGCHAPVAVESVLSVLDQHAFSPNYEAQLQADLELALMDAGIPASREVVLSPSERVDLLAGGVAIEVKTGGTKAALLRQCQRYARHPRVGAVVAVTTKRKHAHGPLPRTLNGKPFYMHVITGGAFA